MACPSLERLERHVAGDEPDPAIDEHLDTCPTCSGEAERITGNNRLLAEFAQANSDPAYSGSSGPTSLPEVAGYEVIREIHRGAQGVVYEAEQVSTKRRVAVKTLAGGAFATARQRYRFEREVELAGALRHPNVVTLHDSGRTGDGGYYLAMELVQGRPLDRYVNHRTEQDGGAARKVARWKLELFAGICAAVNAAHQRGIIHRDLKPANILVDREGRPRVLDFGLARRRGADPAADELARTMEGEFLGTFAYASPEQVGGDASDVDVRSDVYALGVILYEMLTGRRPYHLEGSVADVVDMILGPDPPPPSRQTSSVDDELDAITMAALEKEPGRRYQSAGALLEDVQRYLRGDPINARRHHRWYVLRKTLARHRAEVIVAGVFMAALLVYGASMAVLYSQVTAENAHRVGVFDALMDAFGSEALGRRSDEETLTALLAEFSRAVDGLADYPESEAGARKRLGLAQIERGDRRLALAEFDRALELYLTLHDPPHPLIAEAHHNRGRALWMLGRYDEAEVAYLRALDMRHELYGPRHEDVAMTISHLAATHRRQARFDEAERGYRQALELRHQIHGPESELVAASLNNLGRLLRDLARYEEARRLYEEALAMLRRVAPDDDKNIARAIHNVATCWLAQDEPEKARELFEEALELKLRRYDEDHITVAATRHALAEAVLARGDYDEAETLAAAALAVREAELDPGHPNIKASRDLLETIRTRRP